MSKIKNIIVPTDFSKTAQKATETGLFLSSVLKAKLTMVHARVMFADDTHLIGEGFKELEKLEEKMETALMTQMKDSSARAESNIDVEYDIIRGYSVAPALLDYLNERYVDLIVMGTHGHTGVSHFVIGSVAEKVVRYAPCPVITMREASELSSAPRRILIPFDFTGHALGSLRYAAGFASLFNSQIDLLYVVDVDVHPALNAWGVKSILDTMPDISEKASANFKQVLEKENIKNIKINTHISEGTPYKKIVDFSEENESDLIIITTQALAGLDRVLLGSVTEKVIRAATCPVLTLKHGN